MRSNYENVDLIIDQMQLRFNTLVYKEISSTYHRSLEIELAATKERLKMAEDEIQRERRELTALQFSFENKIHYLEEDRIKLVANNEVLNEKIKNKDKEKDTVVSMWQEKYEN